MPPKRWPGIREILRRRELNRQRHVLLVLESLERELDELQKAGAPAAEQACVVRRIEEFKNSASILHTIEAARISSRQQKQSIIQKAPGSAPAPASSSKASAPAPASSSSGA